MKTKPTRTIVALALFLSTINFPLSTVFGQVPQLLHYQGRAIVNGSPFEGTGQFKFALVNGAGTVTYWSNNGSSTTGNEPSAGVSLPVTKGLYAVLLGDTSLPNMTASIPPSVFANTDVRLRVWFNGGLGFQLVSPDQRIAAVGYALMAGDVPDGTITSAKLALDAKGWTLSGNAGMTSANFLGTTDNQPLDLKVNSLRALRLEPGLESPNVIGGFRGNVVSNGFSGGTIAGGGGPFLTEHRIGGDYATIGGGAWNVSAGYSATVGGGNHNTANNSYVTVSGGADNIASANLATIGGGGGNIGSGFIGTIGGGSGNTASGYAATVGGGVLNISRGENATIPGGFFNEAAENCFAAGNRAKAIHTGSFVWADSTDSDFVSTANNQLLIRASGGVGIGTTTPSAQLEVAGQVKITGGSPGAGKILVCDASGLASWHSPSSLSMFFGQDYTQLFPDVIDNTVEFEISGIFGGNGEKVVMVNGPGLQIQRVIGFQGTNHNDQPGPNMEFPIVFEYSGPQTNNLQNWFNLLQTVPDYRSGSIIVRDLGGTERTRWNFYEMALTQIEPGLNGRKRYTLQHTYPPDNYSGYYRDGSDFPSNPSKNPATDTDLLEIEGVLQGGYPVIQVNTNDRTITLTFDYTEAGAMYTWVRDIAEGTGYKRAMSIIRENGNGVEIGRRNYFGIFPISYQQTTGFGQIEKIKEKIVLSYDLDEPG